MSWQLCSLSPNDKPSSTDETKSDGISGATICFTPEPSQSSSFTNLDVERNGQGIRVVTNHIRQGTSETVSKGRDQARETIEDLLEEQGQANKVLSDAVTDGSCRASDVSAVLSNLSLNTSVPSLGDVHGEDTALSDETKIAHPGIADIIPSTSTESIHFDHETSVEPCVEDCVEQVNTLNAPLNDNHSATGPRKLEKELTNKLDVQRSNSGQEVTDTRGSYNELLIYSKKLAERLEAKDDHINKLLQRLEANDDHVSKLLEHLEVKDDHIDKLLQRLDERENALSNVTAKKSELVEKVPIMLAPNSCIDKIQADLIQAESTMASLSSDNKELRRELGDLNEHVNKLTETVSKCQADFLQAAVTNPSLQKDDIDAMCTMNASLNSQLTCHIESNKNTQARLKDDIEDLWKENESLREQLEQMDTHNAAGLEQATSAVSETKATVTALRDDTDELRRENQSLRKQLEQVGTRNAAGLEQTNSAVSETNATVTSFRSDIEELWRENESLRKELNELRVIPEEQEGDVDVAAPTTSIGFDDVSTTKKRATIPNGYRGFNWDNFSVMSRSLGSGTGYGYGIVSGDYAAYNFPGKPCSISSATPFSVAGFQATAAWRKDMNVLVESFDQSGTFIGSFETTLGHPRDGPTFIDLRQEGNFDGLYKLKITTSGGTNAGLGCNSTQLAIDDLQVY